MIHAHAGTLSLRNSATWQKLCVIVDLILNKMSALARIFGGKKKDQAPTAQEAIQKLRETEEMLEKKSDFLEKKIAQELATAKKNGTKNKRGKRPKSIKCLQL